MNLLESESYDSIMDGKQIRKRPKIGNITDYESLLSSAAEKNLQYEKNPSKDTNIVPDTTDGIEMRKEDLFSKGDYSQRQDFHQISSEFVIHIGQSKRIWAELYKVLDCSDVILQIVDARNGEYNCILPSRCHY